VVCVSQGLLTATQIPDFMLAGKLAKDLMVCRSN